MTIECGELDPGSTRVRAPILVLEVISPSTSSVDGIEKLEEYKAIASLEHILIADGMTAHVIAYRRGPDHAWTYLSHIGLESVIDLPRFGFTLSLAELYEDVPGAAPGTV